jgi:hypothetical protein
MGRLTGPNRGRRELGYSVAMVHWGTNPDKRIVGFVGLADKAFSKRAAGREKPSSRLLI